MKTRSIFALLAAVALSGCVVKDGDDDGGGGDNGGVSDGGDGGGDDGGDTADDGGDAGDDSGGDTTDGGGDAGDGSGDVAPRSGVWDYSEYVPSQNDCNIPADYGDGDGGFGLQYDGAGTFTVFPNDGTANFDCDLDGADFNCPDRLTEEVDVDQSLDATLTGHATAEGTFSDAENATGSQTAIVDCAGADCALLEATTGADFPCTFAVDFVIDWRTGL
jgi:hypothetical protein